MCIYKCASYLSSLIFFESISWLFSRFGSGIFWSEFCADSKEVKELSMI